MAKNKVFRTPVVTALYAYLTREDPEYGGYKVTVELPKGHPIIRQIDTYAADNFRPADTKSPKFKKGYAINPETGMAQVKFSSKFAPKLQDSKGNEVSGVDVWSGSTGVVAFTMDESRKASEPGVKPRLVAFQIGRLKTGGGGRDISAEVGDGAFVAGSQQHKPREDAEDEVRDDGPAGYAEDDDIPF